MIFHRSNFSTLLLRTWAVSALLFTVMAVGSGCDFGAASDAFDEFDVIVELEPVNTVVAAGIVDARTGNCVATNVTLKFVGDDAGSVIDMYSDPMSEQTVEGGLTSFGIANDVVPTPANPVQFRVIATAAGYESGSTTVTLTGVGDADVESRLASRTAAKGQTSAFITYYRASSTSAVPLPTS